MQGKNRVKELRQAANIGQQELADYLGIHVTTLYRWERHQIRHPSDDQVLLRCANRLGVTVPFLLGWTNGEEAA